ncbi:hypothetical protein RQP52_13540 [Paenibacillus sp. PFR10]|uniref:Uncharacterized protein n=1 Tax=Paenibacillus violae TaxID=3077234 RepID=A0ABU3RCW4_9BACL|nr:hypothetical protein [Paenibacillus sp. PFR10]
MPSGGIFNIYNHQGVGQKEDMEEGKLVTVVITARPDTPQLAAIVTE